MNLEPNNTPKHKYKLVKWDKPAPILPEAVAWLTKREAQQMNRAFRMNHTTKRYVLDD